MNGRVKGAVGRNRAFPHRPTLFALEYDSSSLGDSDESLVLIIPITPNVLAEKIRSGMRGPEAHPQPL